MSARPTPGPWYLTESPPQVSDKSFWFDERGARHGDTPNMLVSFDSPEDAKLFFEAGTVYHETQITPRELADQRAELLAVLSEANGAINAMAAMVDAEWRDHQSSMTKNDKIVCAFREKVRALIAKCKAGAA